MNKYNTYEGIVVNSLFPSPNSSETLRFFTLEDICSFRSAKVNQQTVEEKKPKRISTKELYDCLKV